MAQCEARTGEKHKSELEEIRVVAPVGGDSTSASACAQVARREGSVGRIRKEQPD
jgi:hypothetical protein